VRLEGEVGVKDAPEHGEGGGEGEFGTVEDEGCRIRREGLARRGEDSDGSFGGFKGGGVGRQPIFEFGDEFLSVTDRFLDRFPPHQQINIVNPSSRHRELGAARLEEAGVVEEEEDGGKR
jgi:hypothetical protein